MYMRGGSLFPRALRKKGLAHTWLLSSVIEGTCRGGKQLICPALPVGPRSKSLIDAGLKWGEPEVVAAAQRQLLPQPPQKRTFTLKVTPPVTPAAVAVSL